MYQKSKLVLCTLFLCLSGNASAWAADPGSLPGVAPIDLQAGGTKPGSILLYNLFTSSGTDASHDTQVSLTNTHPSRPAAVHLFFVDGSSCAVSDSYICLTANQTAVFLASDVDPFTTGYVIAIVTHTTTGVPINFNYLIGSEYVKLPTGHAAKLMAEAVAANYDRPFPTSGSGEVAFAELKFNGRQYARLPRMLAADEVGALVEGNHTLLVVNSVGGNLATGAVTIGRLFGILYDDAESAYSFFKAVNACQFIVRSLDDTFPLTTPVFSQAVSLGHTGWMRLWAAGERPLFGAAIRLNRNTTPSQFPRRSFSGGANLHHLRLVESATVTIPVFPASC